MEKQSVKACSITDKFISSLVGIEGVLSVIDCLVPHLWKPFGFPCHSLCKTVFIRFSEHANP